MFCGISTIRLKVRVVWHFAIYLCYTSLAILNANLSLFLDPTLNAKQDFDYQ